MARQGCSLPFTEDRKPLRHFYKHQEGKESPSPAARSSRIPPLGPWSWVQRPPRCETRSPPVRYVRFIHLTRSSRSGDLGCSLSTQTLRRCVFEAHAPRTSAIPLFSHGLLRASGLAVLRGSPPPPPASRSPALRLGLFLPALLIRSPSSTRHLFAL